LLIAIAEFERDLLIERTHAGIARAEDKPLGRPSALTGAQQAEALRRLATGESVSQLARDYGTTRQSIMRARERAAAVRDSCAPSLIIATRLYRYGPNGSN
jgi:putative DNA-invertase from lambdoid prophage Rac